ncbi:hypothetical protein CFOL_v3_10938 [Cephalotus follicularis]|uniref:RVT_2 domain-containing protein n=1 Tax=Cephalotus follicularis TaxID=3775 RepID=A0A1Q3BHW2_CEPFO|nr:hypothetical protein CFOL_v3_10938 [Cephalotus follicularis]
MDGAKPITTPISTTSTLSKHLGKPLSNPTEYRSLVKALQYVTLTRPDISFAVNKVYQFMATPTDIHWSLVKRILRYLKGSLHYGLHLQQSPSQSLTAFSDVDWASCPDDKKSTSGYLIFLGPNLISWQSRKQQTAARSSTKSEYRALVLATSELTWLQSLLSELGVCLPHSPILWCDNIGATYLSVNPVFHARTKHIEIDFHFVRDKVAKRDLQVHFISTQDQIADILTKGLPSGQFSSLRSKLQLLPRPLSLWGDVRI